MQNNMKNFIKDDEMISDLQRDGLFILQKKNSFKFGTDAVLLSDFAADIKSDRIMDLCTGSGIVPILLHAKTSAKEIWGVEIQHSFAEMAQRSVEMNNIGKRVKIIEADLKKIDFEKRSLDMITCNPPYMEYGNAVINEINSKTIARHEILCKIDDITRTASKLLKTKGHLVMVHRPSRLCDVTEAMRRYDIEPKRIRFVHSQADKTPVLFLIDGIYKGGKELKILPPLLLQNKDGGESDEIKKIYGRFTEERV